MKYKVEFMRSPRVYGLLRKKPNIRRLLIYSTLLTLLANALPIVLLLITFFVESQPPITGFSTTGFLDFLPDLVENCDLSKSSLIESINLSNPG